LPNARLEYPGKIDIIYFTAMQKKTVLFLLVLCCTGVRAELLPANGMLVAPRGMAPLYEKPDPEGLPFSYLEASDTCRVSGAAADSTGVDWFSLTSGSKSGWVRESSVQPLVKQEETVSSAVTARTADPDAKRRYRILSQHAEWPRRIVKVVREGRICLDMNQEQLAAAWGEPLEKSSAFILGLGSQELWFYRGSDGKNQVVFLVKGRVVGWSEK
jgi:hypothetical protein